MKKTLGITIVLGGLSLTAAAQRPLGPEFHVNTGSVGFSQPSVAGNGSGAFVVTWLNGDFSSHVVGQRYDATGAPLGGEFFVVDSPGTTRAQADPAVAMKSSGDFVVVWTGRILGPSAYQNQIFARRFASSGAPIGSEFRVDNAATAYSSNPRVAFDTNGGFAVVWGQQPEPYVAYRQYDASANPLGPPGNVGDFAQYADVVAVHDGSFVVPWYDAQTPGNIWARRVDATGTPNGAKFLVGSNAATNYPAPPRAAAGPSGDFTVAWVSGSYPRLQIRRYDASASPLGASVPIDLDGVGNGIGAITGRIGAGADSQGRMLFAWQTVAGGGGVQQVRGRLLNGGELVLNTGSTVSFDHFLPGVAAVAPGEFVVAWQNDGYVSALRVVAPLRGDANGDRQRDIVDVFYLINFLFAGGPAPVL
jgi:hypothetical protein